MKYYRFVVTACILLVTTVQVSWSCNFDKIKNSIPTYSTEVKGQYADLNGIRLYYEINGSGEPLILLHGGFFNMDYWSKQVQVFSQHYQVITVDGRGHGRSTDGTAPITHAAMALDILALMNLLNINKASIVGWSDGAVIALNMCILAPERINKIVLNGANTHFKKTVPYLEETMVASRILFYPYATMLYSPSYKAINPYPSHWSEFFNKMQTMWTSDCYLINRDGQTCEDPLKSITNSALVIVGEDEMILESHTREIKDALPNSTLIIIPGGSHYLAREKPDEFGQAVLSFLEE
ncbi:MAG: alpha/beta hydrolase [Oligoflexia bacterium]|nr:alpha/beta hydrolase [Oligoflexia bacterium]